MLEKSDFSQRESFCSRPAERGCFGRGGGVGGEEVGGITIITIILEEALRAAARKRCVQEGWGGGGVRGFRGKTQFFRRSPMYVAVLLYCTPADETGL
jgi:hypothetical protein